MNPVVRGLFFVVLITLMLWAPMTSANNDGSISPLIGARFGLCFKAKAHLFTIPARDDIKGRQNNIPVVKMPGHDGKSEITVPVLGYTGDIDNSLTQAALDGKEVAIIAYENLRTKGNPLGMANFPELEVLSNSIMSNIDWYAEHYLVVLWFNPLPGAK